MHKLILSAFALSASSVALAGGISLTVEGECPGAVTITATGSTGAVFIAAGAMEGSTVIPRGACSGVDLGIESEGSLFTFGAIPDSDGDGTIVFAPTVPEAACDMHMVAVDLPSCNVSSVATFPGGLYEHDNGLGMIWYNDVPPGTIDEGQASASCEATYPGQCERRDGDCAGSGYCYNGDPGYEPCWGWESGCSGEAGRVWEYGSSYTTYGYWN